MLSFLYRKTDNSPLIAFRILLGGLLAYYSANQLFGTATYQIYIEPKVQFSFIGFEWLTPLPGNGMYWFHGIMCLLAVCICVGFMYRTAMALFTLQWAATYFMQKSIYNNHHYLLLLLCLFMCLLPANAYASIDSRRNPKIKKYSMPYWYILLFIAQIAIVYFYASMAKLYPDWFNGTYTGILLEKYKNSPVNVITDTHFFALFIAYGGIAFDLLIVPLLLYRKTRVLAAIASVGFHTFNWYTLNIGIFPFLSLAYLVFFFPPEKVRHLFFRNKPVADDLGTVEATPYNKRWVYCFLLPYLLIQVALPLRHYLIMGDVTWTEEGHRLSWRMMLKHKKGTLVYKLKDLTTGKTFIYDEKKLFTDLQIKNLSGRTDMIWQSAQFIHAEFAKKGQNVAVYVTAKISLNHHPERLLIDPDVDLAHTKWDMWRHSKWVLLYDN